MRRRLALGLAMCFTAGVAIVACGGGTAHADPCGDIYARPSITPLPANYKSNIPVTRFDRRYAVWLRSASIKQLDPRQLPSEAMDVDAETGYPNFECAVDLSDLVVAGTVKANRSIPDRTITTFAVDRVAKGAAPATITVLQDSYVFPRNVGTKAFGPPVVQTDPGNPLLAPGDRVVLLLDALDSTRTRLVDHLNGISYLIQRASGQFVVRDGRVRSLPLSPFHDVDGLTEQQLMDRAHSEAVRRS